jgi:polysaccharide deacetylase 2 family uncharacterized protein YibQ
MTAVWVWLHAGDTVKDWEKRTPHAVATVKTVYTSGTGESEAATQKPADFASDINMPPPSPGQGYITVIMTDIGISETDTGRAMEDLPQDMTLAFSPYSPNLADWMQKARSANRETLILIPMEPVTYPRDDPGPQALLTRHSDADNSRRLDWVLRQANGAVGAMNYMGSSLLADEKNLTSVLNALYKRSSLFVENPQGPESMAEDVAERTSTPYLKADIHIDKSAAELDVKQQLLKLENLAKQRGYAVGIAQPYPITFGILKAWAAGLDSRGIKLVPLAALWKAKSRSASENPPSPPVP